MAMVACLVVLHDPHPGCLRLACRCTADRMRNVVNGQSSHLGKARERLRTGLRVNQLAAKRQHGTPWLTTDDLKALVPGIDGAMPAKSTRRYLPAFGDGICEKRQMLDFCSPAWRFSRPTVAPGVHTRIPLHTRRSYARSVGFLSAASHAPASLPLERA